MLEAIGNVLVWAIVIIVVLGLIGSIISGCRGQSHG
jgi:hypothetical protein